MMKTQLMNLKNLSQNNSMDSSQKKTCCVRMMAEEKMKTDMAIQEEMEKKGLIITPTPFYGKACPIISLLRKSGTEGSQCHGQ